MPEPSPLVCSPSVTVLAGLVHEHGVAVLADRATIEPNRHVAHGMAAPGPPTRKVFFAPDTRIVAGIAGAAAVPGVDLLARLRHVVRHSTPANAHAALMSELTAAAPPLREHYALTTQVTPFRQPVMTVVLLGSYDVRSTSPQLSVYGIPDAGPPVFQSLQRSMGWAPSSVQMDAEHMLQQDKAATPVADQAQVWGGRLSALAPLCISRQKLDISAEWDAAVCLRPGP